MTQRKRMSRRDFLRGSLVAGAAGVMAAGCVEGMPVAAPADGGAVMQETTTVRASHWWGGFMTPSFEAAAKALPVEITEEMTPWGEYNQKLLTQLAGGVAPDLIEVAADNFGDFWPSGRIATLDELVAERDMTKWGFDQWVENGYEGSLYGLSIFYPEQMTLWINKEISDAEGIDIPNPGDPDFDTWTWDAFVEVLQALTKRSSDGTVERYGMSMWIAGLNGLGLTMVYQNGGQIFDTEDNYKESEILLTSPEVIESFQQRYDLVHTHKVGMPPSEVEAVGGVSRAWSAERCAITSSWGNPQNIVEHPFLYDHLPWPYKEQKVQIYGGNCWSLNKDSAVIEEAFELMWFITTDDLWAQYRTDSFHNAAYETRSHIDRMPRGVNRDLAEGVVYRDPAVKNAEFQGGGDGIFGPRWLGEKAALEIQRRMGTAEEEILLQKKTVEEALTDAKAEIDSLLQR